MSEQASAVFGSSTGNSDLPDSVSSSPEKQQIQELYTQLQSALKEIGTLRQRALAESHSQASLAGNGTESAVAEQNIWLPAWNGFRRGFVLAYSIRAGLGTMTRALALAKAGQYKDLRGWRLVSESGLKYRLLRNNPIRLVLTRGTIYVVQDAQLTMEDAVRLGFFIGGFTGSYHLLTAALNKWQGDKPAQNCMAAGTAAGLTLLFLSKERRRTLALYMLARLAQCGYNSLKEQGQFHFWGSDWAYGDALLFALSCGQVMYAYVMRPETLPKSYWKFIVKSGPVEAPALEAVRRSIRGIPIDLKAFNAFLKKRGSPMLLSDALPKRIPDVMLHPQTASAFKHSFKVPMATFRKTFPLYMSLSLVPYVVLNLKRALKSPIETAAHAVGSAVRSTSFLAAFVGIYSSVISVQRKMVSWDNKLVYYVAGLLASGSILIEKKNRRSELALYVMPRAVDSFALGLMKRRWVPSVKFGEVLLFSLCMGGLMYFRQHEPQTMAPLLNTLISRIVFGETKKKKGDMPRPSSMAFSEGDFPGSYQQLLSATNSPVKGTSQQPQSAGLFQASPPPAMSAPSDNSQQQSSSSGPQITHEDHMQQAASSDTAAVNGMQPIHATSQFDTASNTSSRHAEDRSHQPPSNGQPHASTAVHESASVEQKDSNPSQRASAESGVSQASVVNASSDAEKSTDTLANDIGDGKTQQSIDSGVSEQEAVEAETLVSSRDDLVSLVQGTNELIGQLAARSS